MDSLKTTNKVKEISLDETSQQVCPQCHGKKIVGGELINIMNLCPKCGGYGSLDWVEFATGNTTRARANYDLQFQLAVKNSERLAQKIKHLFISAGTTVRVSIRTIRPDPLSKIYHNTPESEMIEKELISI